MRKMKLDIDQLAVESFSVDGNAEGRGTVEGNAATLRFCTVQTCGATCELSCNGSCLTYPNCQQVC